MPQGYLHFWISLRFLEACPTGLSTVSSVFHYHRLMRSSFSSLLWLVQGPGEEQDCRCSYVCNICARRRPEKLYTCSPRFPSLGLTHACVNRKIRNLSYISHLQEVICQAPSLSYLVNILHGRYILKCPKLKRADQSANHNSVLPIFKSRDKHHQDLKS